MTPSGPVYFTSTFPCIEAVHLKPNVVDAAPRLSSLDAGCGVVLEVEDCQVDVAVGEEAAASSRIVDLADLFHAEHLDVEPGGPFHVLGRERDVLDLGHDVSPSASWGSRYVRRRSRVGQVRSRSPR